MVMLLLFFIVAVGNLCGMDLSIVEQKSSEITFKSLHATLKGFPCCWSVNRITSSWEKVPENTRKKIEEQIVASNDEQFLALFNVATKLLPELQKKIANHLNNDYEDAIKKFFNAPIADVINDYPWSQQVFCGEELKAFQRSSNWKTDVIFGHAKDIVVFEKSYRTDFSGCNREALKSIAKVCDIFSDVIAANEVVVNYTFRDSYTLTNFMKYHSLWQWYGLPLVLTPFSLELVLSLIKNNQLSVAEILSKNEKKEVLNAFIQSNFEKTGDRGWLVFIKKLVNPDEYSKGIGPDKIFLTHCCYVFLSPYILFQDSVSKILNSINIVSSIAFIAAIAIASGLSGAVLHYRFFDGLQHPVLGIIYATSCYAIAVILWNVVKMRSVKDAPITIDNLSELLQRTDIEIL